MTIDNYNRLRADPKSVTYVFDENGDLLWHRVEAVIPQKTNGGRVEGISDAGEYIAVSDGARFSLYDIKTQKELWNIIIESGLNLIMIFTKDILAFYPIPEGKTKILTLRKDGTLDDNYTITQFIVFSYDMQSKLYLLQESLPKVAPILVKKYADQFVLSRFTMKLKTSK